VQSFKNKITIVITFSVLLILCLLNAKVQGIPTKISPGTISKILNASKIKPYLLLYCPSWLQSKEWFCITHLQRSRVTERQRFQFIFTPKHASWLKILESLFS